MSFHNTVICDFCGAHYHLNIQEMEAPPGWLLIRFAVASLEGLLPPEDEDTDNFMHFCSQDCAAQYCRSDKLRDFMVAGDYDKEDEDIDDDDYDDENMEGTK